MGWQGQEEREEGGDGCKEVKRFKINKCKKEEGGLQWFKTIKWADYKM